MLLPDETYEQATCPKNKTIIIPTITTKKIIELSTTNSNNNNSIIKVPASVIDTVSNIKGKIKKSSLLKSSIINNTIKSASTTNLNGIIISKNDQISTNSNIKENNHHNIHPEYQSYNSHTKYLSDTKFEEKKLSNMINHYNNYNNITSSSSSASVSSSSSSPTLTSSSIFDYEDVIIETNDVLKSKKILSLSTDHIINFENIEIFNEQQKRRSSIASYDRTSDFFNHIPDFIGEALNPFSIKNVQQQKQLQKKKQQQQQQHNQRIVKFKNNDDIDINMNNKNNIDNQYRHCHQQRITRRHQQHQQNQQSKQQQNKIPKIKNSIDDNDNVHNNVNNQYNLQDNNEKFILNNDNNNNNNKNNHNNNENDNENSSDGSSDNSNNNNHKNHNGNLNFNNNNNNNNNMNTDREFESFHNSSDILKICEEFLWRYRIRPDFFCKYHKALSNSTNSSPKSRSITKQQKLDLNQNQKLHQSLNDSQQQYNKKIIHNNNNNNKIINNATNLKKQQTTTTLLIQENSSKNSISQKSSNVPLNNIINQQQINMNPLATVINHPVVKMKRFRKATAIYTLPTRPSKKTGSVSSSTDASSSNEAVHLQQRLKSLSTELVTLRNRLHVGQTGTGGTGGGNTNANSGTTTTTTSVGGGGSGAGSGLTPSAPLTGLSLNINSNNGNGNGASTTISTNSILQSNCNTSGTTGTTQSTNGISGTKSQSNLSSYNQIGSSGTTTISNTINSDIGSGGGGNNGPGANNIRNSNISVNKTYPLSIPPGANSSSGVGNSAIISSRNTSIPLPLPHHVVGSLDARCETLPRRSLGILSDIHSATVNGTTTTTTTTQTTHSTHIKPFDAIISHTTKPLTFDYVNGNSNGHGTLNGINGINGTITNCGGNFNIITATTKTIDNGKQKKPHEMDDLIHLTGPLTEDAVMRTLHSRFNGNQYFTNVGPILLSINPYHDVGNPLTLSSTRTLPLASQLRRIVQEAVRQQAETGYPQAIILSGTSGAGKTHCSMLLLRQLFAVAGGGPETDAFKHLAAAFTVLRSLGSAKTTTNSESSRIGQFIEVQVTDGALYRTKIHCYFLDQTRVVRPLPNEKNYHIFYQMLAGLSREERIKLNLEGYTPSNLRYLQNGDTHQDEVEDSTRFQAWKTCLGILGIPFLDVVRVLAAVLLLGNVQFVDGQGLEVDVKGEAELNSVAGLLGVPPAALFRGLTTRTHNARGQLVKSVCDANMSNMTRDCLAKALYCRTVATIVRRANSLKRLGSTLGTLSSDSNESVHNQGDVASQHASTIGGNSGSKSMAALNNAVRHATDGFIGILDMFGFEEQSPAQLEHLCINLCAETMQHFYNTHIFKSSVESCRDEGILCDTEVDYVDNVPCIDLISSLRTGLLSMLDAECSIRGTAESYVAKIKVQHRNSTRLETKQTELHDPRMFTIRHFAGKVEYDATEFLDTNRDVVPDDLVAVFYKHTCNFGFATHLFGSELKALYAMENVPRGLSFRIAPTSHTDLLNGDEPVSTLTQDFHTRLDNLLRTLVHARPHFVRCIRSNSNEISGHFERMTVVKQIRALQVLETVNLMASGFPHRMRFKQFTARYKLLAPFRLLRRCEEKALEDCDLILQYAMENLPEIDGSVTLSWAPGKRHVFLSEGIRQHLENLRSDVRTKSATLIQATWRGWQLRKRIGTVRRPREIMFNSTKLNKNTPNAAPRISSTTTGTTTRPRPQPIAGTPPPDPNEKCDSKIIQQTCTLFGLDLERPPPVPPSRPYTVTGNSKLGYPQTRIMKMNFPEDSITNPPVEQLKKGETVTVVGASHCRGHLIVEHKGQSFHVPFQYMSSPWKISKCMEN